MFHQRQKRIYLDYASLAPRDERLFRRQLPSPMNAGSLHKEGVLAKRALSEARKMVAENICAHPDEIVFTSGGTEADNLALLGVLFAYKGTAKPHIIVSAIEHAAVRECAKWILAKGLADITEISVDEKGLTNLLELKEALRPETILVSVMMVNNEIGTIEAIAEIAKTIRHFKKDKVGPYPLFHTDACQAPATLPIDVRSLHPDLLSLNGGKIYAGTGNGALFVRRGMPIESILHGGEQEKGLRPGTENVEGAEMFALALAECARARTTETKKYELLRTEFLNGIEEITKRVGVEVKIISSPEVTVPNIVNISFSGFESELLVLELDAKGIAVSSKSACKADSDEPSHVLSALGQSASWRIPANIGSVRFSFGRWTTKRDIMRTVAALEKIFLKYKKQ